MFRVFLFLLVSFLFGSCTTPVFLTRTDPPEMTLEPQPAKIVFTNQFDYSTSPAIKDKHEIAYETGIGRFAEALFNDTLHENMVVSFIENNPGNLPVSGNLHDGNMDPGEVKAICRSNEADFLLSLDSLRLFFDWEVIREDQSDGGVSKTKDFYLTGNYYVTLYDSSGEPVKRTLLGRELPYTSRPTLGALITILPNLANATGKISILARDAALEYTGMFYPSQVVTGEKVLYTHKVFKETNQLILQKDYDRAIELLEQMPDTLKAGLIRKRDHNLSVARFLREFYTDRIQ